MARLTCVLLFVFATLTLEAQIVRDSWLDHLSYNYGKSVAVSNSKVYCATECMFSYDKEDNRIEHITPIEGLSETGVSCIAYSDKHDIVVIGYNNGNIDLLHGNGKIYNLSGLKEKKISSDKCINHINIVGDTAYLSSNLGLVAINIKRKEFIDSYILGDNNKYVKVLSSIKDGDYLYAFTEDKAMRGSIDNPFLTDLKNWEYINPPEEDTQPYAGCKFNRKLYIACSLGTKDYSKIYSFDGTNWISVIDSIPNIKSMTSNDGKMVICTKTGMIVYDENINAIITRNDNNIIIGIADGDFVWYAHSKYGLVKYQENAVKAITPNGPNQNLFYNVCYLNDQVMIAPGGMSTTNANLYRRAFIYTYNGSEWIVTDINTIPKLKECRDIINFTSLGSKDHYIINSWRCGLIEFNNGEYIYHTSESTDGILSDIVSHCTMDHNGNLWAVCSFSEFPIAVRTTDGQWHSYAYGNNMVGKYTGKVICTKNNDLWMASNKSEGILAWNDNGTPDNKNDDDYKFFSPHDKDGESLNTGIHDFAEDKDGTIWFATDEGVYIYEHPERLLQGQTIYGRYPQMIEDGVYQPLLKTEIVNTIAIDDKNRKWFGTANGGIFVISPDGTKQYAVYNKANSPLFSNNVLSLAIDNDNGIIYIITDKGLQSARISATKPESDLSNIYAFPNPVEPDFYGDVTIRGLMSETVVKITDLYGNLVYETMSNGGSAIWNVCNMDGKRVETGIYLIQCVTADGTVKDAGKIHVIK